MDTMMKNEAKDRLVRGNLTFCLYNGTEFIDSKERGVAPLIKLLDREFCGEDFVAVDKVVGMGAAYLYAKLKIKSVYALVISQGAKNVLDRFGIASEWENIVPYIVSRSGVGLCPIESVLSDKLSTDDALEKIRTRLEELKNK